MAGEKKVRKLALLVRGDPGCAAHLVRPVLLVHVQDMYPEAVSLLEGPVAEVARELPVSLVHAPRVFQVLVSVIFVGKNLSTPVTLETLPRV